MTVVSAYIGKLKPGQLDRAVELGQKAKKVLEKNGAKDVRMLATALGAESYGSTVFSTEHENYTAFGAFYDKIMNDDELLSLMHQAEAPDGPYVMTMLTNAVELPLGHKRTAKHGRIIDVYVSRPAPGRFEAGLAFASRAFDFLEKHGAKNCRAFQQDAAGSQSGTTIGVWEFDSMAAYGKAADAWITSAEGQALGSLMQSSDAPMTPVSHDVYADIPL